MADFPIKYAPYALSILRIISALMFIMHGTQKLFAFPGGQQAELFSLMGFAGIIEFAAGLLILFGLFTRVAAFIACGEMAVAYFMVHAPRSAYPILNEGELAVLYCFIFLYFAARGAGPWSLDTTFHKRNRPA